MTPAQIAALLPDLRNVVIIAWDVGTTSFRINLPLVIALIGHCYMHRLTSLNERDAGRSYDKNRTGNYFLTMDEEPTDRYFGANLPVVNDKRAAERGHQWVS